MATYYKTPEEFLFAISDQHKSRIGNILSEQLMSAAKKGNFRIYEEFLSNLRKRAPHKMGNLNTAFNWAQAWKMGRFPPNMGMETSLRVAWLKVINEGVYEVDNDPLHNETYTIETPPEQPPLDTPKVPSVAKGGEQPEKTINLGPLESNSSLEEEQGSAGGQYTEAQQWIKKGLI